MTKEYITISVQKESYILSPGDLKILRKHGIDILKTLQQIRINEGIKAIYGVKKK